MLDDAESNPYEDAMAAYDRGHLNKAFKGFLAGAQAGDVDCMAMAAVMYGAGEGVRIDLAQSIEWDKKAIAAGSELAFLNIGISYRCMGDMVSAKHWFERALQAGDPEAALQLAKLYMVSALEAGTVKKYLDFAIGNGGSLDETRAEARALLATLPAARGKG
jgi:TPR repeat protein